MKHLKLFEQVTNLQLLGINVINEFKHVLEDEGFECEIIGNCLSIESIGSDGKDKLENLKFSFV